MEISNKKITLVDVFYDPYKIQLIENSEKHCLIAVKRGPNALGYIKTPSRTVIKAALRAHGNSIRWVNKPDEELYLIALSGDGYAIQHIPENCRSEKVLKKSLKESSGRSIKHILNPSEKICEYALKLDSDIIQYIKNPSEPLWMKSVKIDGTTLRYIPFHLQTVELCIAALNTNKSAYRFVRICEKDIYENTMENLLKMNMKNKILSLV